MGKGCTKNFGFNVCFLVSCFVARLEVIMAENMIAMRREAATKKNLDEAIVLETKVIQLTVVCVLFDCLFSNGMGVK